MAFTSLLSRLGSIPKVICGPILRRTTITEVSVWIATKVSGSLSLSVYNEDTNALIATGPSSSGKRFGANLYVYVLRVTSLNLSPSINYGYDINFPGSETLSSNDILETGSNGISKILFPGSTLTRPTFSIPPAAANFSDLRLLHASCRKPHGENLDAFDGMYDILNNLLLSSNTGTFKANKRPHQLFLTGDQIYADDVADVMLFMLNDAITPILGWSETLPGKNPQSAPPTNTELAIGNRAAMIREKANLSVDLEDGANHLVRLGDFYNMYLFAWSPELWPSALPDYSDIYPGRATQVSTRFGPVDTAHYAVFKQHRKAVEYFKASLDKVRKVLANIPTYMILDDHEITDDWNFNWLWCNSAFNSDLGKRIMTNGLSAYAIFQDWGNQPLQYSSGAGVGLFNALLYGPPSTPNLVTAQPLVLPTINTNNPADKLLDPPSSGIRWDFILQMTDYEILFLDTRTMRGFPNGNWGYSALIHKTYLSNQIVAASPSSLFTIVVAPSPVFGVPSVELGKIVSKSYKYMVEKDAEDWGLNEVAVQNLLASLTLRCTGPTNNKQGRILLLTGDVHYGFSSRIQFWGTRPMGQPVGNYNMVIIQLTASSLKNEVKEDTFGSYFVHNYGYIPTSVGLSPSQQRFGYGLPGPNPRPIGPETRSKGGTYVDVINVTKEPTLFTAYALQSHSWGNNNSVTRTIVDPPDWRFRRDFLMDATGISNRPLKTPTPVNFPFTGTAQAILTEYAKQSGNYQDYAKLWGPGREIVGTNNFGEITFVWPSGSTTPVLFHTLWWRLESNTNVPLDVMPLTQHVVPFSYSYPGYPMPTY